MRGAAIAKRIRIFCRGGWKQKESRKEGGDRIKYESFAARYY